MLGTVALVCVLLICVYAVFRQLNCTHQCLAHLPTFSQLPLIGSAHYFLGGGRRLFLLLLQLTEIYEETQLPFLIWMGPYPNLLFTDLDDIKCVNNHFLEKPYYYNFLKMWLGNGLITAPAVPWKRNIKKLAGTFTASTVASYQNVFNMQAQKLVHNLKAAAKQGECYLMHEHLTKISLEAITQIALGVPKISDSIVTTEYYEAFIKTIEVISIRGFNLLLHPDFLFGLSPYKKQMMKAVDTLHHLSETVINTRRQHENPKESNDTYNNAENTKGNFKSFLNVLLELNKKDPTFTMEQVKNEVHTLIFAGQETIATTLFFTLLMIGSHSDVQNKLYAEINEIFGDNDRELRQEDLARLNYCEAVIDETLRLFPPVPFVFRIADHDLQLKSCIVPKGTNCVINIFGAGRSKKYWGPDAYEFRPERFESSSITPMIPFSVGRRACIGKRYAMPIIKTILAYCVRNFEFTSEADKIEFKLDIILRTVHTKLLQVKLR